MNDLITIAIPTYKRPKYLSQAIDSAINQLNASIPYSIIVLNNDPETDLTELEHTYRNAPVDIRFYTNEKNLGMLGNVNRCVKMAKSKWVAFLHDDDLLLPSYIQEIEKFINDTDVGCLIPRRYLLFDGDGRACLEARRRKKHMLLELFPSRHMSKTTSYPIRPEDNVFAWQNCYGAPSCGVLFKKDAIESCGLFFPEGTYAWDFLSFLKLNQEYNIKILHPILSVYRMTTGLSLRPEVQLDFYKSFEQVKEIMPSLHKECKSFIREYDEEISYLNTCILDETGKKLARDEGYKLKESISSRVKYVQLMLHRFRYLANHHLDVEVPLTQNGRKTLIQMGIIQE